MIKNLWRRKCVRSGIFWNVEISAPFNLHSDNVREFCNLVVTELCVLWKDVKIVFSKPQGNQDIQKMCDPGGRKGANVENSVFVVLMV